jgi:hypothetical protein
MIHLYVDESGDHNLLDIDPNYPIFVLGGIIIDVETHNSILNPKLADFKTRLLGSKDIILHCLDYSRSKNGFEKMRDRNFRKGFFTEIENIIKITNFTLLACIIDKVAHRKKYIYASDPYILSLEILIEKFTFYLKHNKQEGIIIAESRGPQLDNALELAFLNTKINGTRFFAPKEITERIKGLVIKKQNENVAGLQITDSVVSQIGRKYLKYKAYFDYEVIKSKFDKHSCGKYLGYGLVILPKK